MRKVFATDFGIWPIFGEVSYLSDMMVNSSDYWTRLANYILLYDRIVIPTGNFQILPVLRIILGEEIFNELIRNKIIVLARFDQWFAYRKRKGLPLVKYIMLIRRREYIDYLLLFLKKLISLLMRR